jgi:phage terminase small subunit
VHGGPGEAVTKPLTVKERRFIDGYLGSCAGNATQAYRLAGYKARTANVAASSAHKLLRKPKIVAAVTARQRRRTTAAILTAEQRDQHLSSLALNPLVPAATQVSAIKELNKCSGRHSIKHVLDVTESLSDIIAGSRA